MRRPAVGPRAWSTSSSNGAKPGRTSAGSSGSNSHVLLVGIATRMRTGWSRSHPPMASPRSLSDGEDLLDAVAGSGLEIDEQRDADQDEYERNDPAGDERDLDERRRSVLAICGDLFQACCLRPRMTDEASDFGLDDLAGLEFVSRPIDVLLGAIVFALARVAP